MSLLNRILSAFLALALFIGGMLAAAEIVLAALGRPPWLLHHQQWATWLRGQTWDAPIMRAVLVGLVVLGILLLIPALRRGKPGDLALPSRTEGVHVSASRRGVEKTLAAAARRTDGISAATVKVGRRNVRVRAFTRTRSQPGLPQRVTAAVTERLERLGLSDTLRPRVTLSRKEAR